jgi:4-diphosphocytidyl-2-C-methyl-D-erythritol kinase
MPIARALGADVPVCIASKTRIMSGIGHDLGEETPITPLPVLLVNPKIAVSTAAIFKALKHYTPHPPAHHHNDLETPAIHFAPVIGEILHELKGLEGVTAARMSGSGATCFAIFKSDVARDFAYETYANKHGSYWVKKTTLGLENLT